jgi:PhnB protein
MAKPVPDGFNTVNVYLVVKDARAALDFYQKAFGAEKVTHMAGPGGKGTMHAEMRIGNSTIMLTDENPQWGMKSPKTLGGSPASVHIYTPNADAMFERAVTAGCEATMPIMDAFWGDRYGKVKDPFGHEWGIATHKEDLSEQEIGKRAAKWFAEMGC